MTDFYVEFRSVDEAIEECINRLEWLVSDASFGYEYGSISGIQRAVDVELKTDVFSFAIKVPASAGWMWETDGDGDWQQTVDVDGISITVVARPHTMRIRRDGGFWYVAAGFDVTEV